MKADIRLKKYLEIIPKDLPAFIVGGAAVNYDKATDVDIVVLMPELAPVDPAPPDFLKGIDGFYVYGGFGSCYEEGFEKLLAGTIPKVFEKEVQIMISRESTIEEVLEGFDVSTHQWAIDREGRYHKAKTATSPKVMPRVTRWSSAVSTLQRYGKVCLRYGIPQHEGDLKQLKTFAALQVEHKQIYERKD